MIYRLHNERNKLIKYKDQIQENPMPLVLGTHIGVIRERWSQIFTLWLASQRTWFVNLYLKNPHDSETNISRSALPINLLK